MMILRFLLPIAFFAALPTFAGDIPEGIVERIAVRERASVEGVIEAHLEARIAAEVAGRVLEVRTDAGKNVKAGEVLFVLDDASIRQEVAAARARLAQAEANLANARSEYARAQELFAQKFISASRLDAAKSALDAAVAERNAAAAQLARAEAGLAYTQVRAPFSGVIAQRLVNQGDMAQPGMPLALIYQPGAMRAVADVPQERLRQLGQPLEARVEVPSAAAEFVATAVVVLPDVDPRTQTQRLRAELPKEASHLVPGTFARVHLSGQGTQRLVIPEAAILRRGELTAVYVATPQGWRLRQVRLGERIDGERVQILSGLQEGDRVALDPVRAAMAVGRGQ